MRMQSTADRPLSPWPTARGAPRCICGSRRSRGRRSGTRPYPRRRRFLITHRTEVVLSLSWTISENYFLRTRSGSGTAITMFTLCSRSWSAVGVLPDGIFGKTSRFHSIDAGCQKELDTVTERIADRIRFTADVDSFRYGDCLYLCPSF